MQDSLPASLSVAFLHPFFDELLRRGIKRPELAARISLNEASLFNPAVSVPANTVYGFLSWIAEETADPLLCARVGQQMAMGGWAPLLPLMVSAKTVGDFFQKFSLMSSEQSESVIYKLEVEGAVAIWRLLRAKGASDDAFFADAVAAGFFVELLKSAAQDDWEAAKTIAVLPDTSLVPRDLLPSTSVLSGQSGLILRFPSRYLGLDIPVMLPPDDLPTMSVPNMPKQKLVERVHQLISHRIGEPDLGVKDVAKGLGLATWKLQSLLKAEGLSFSSIKENIRRNRAIEEVRDTTGSIGSIASRLGYTNSSNFTRAFRGWTSKSPRDYRRVR